MEDLTTSLYVIIGTIIVIIAIFAITKYSKNKKTERIKQLAELKGWKYTSIREPISWGFRLETHRWRLKSVAQSISAASDEKTSNIAHTTRWSGNNSPAEPGFILIIGSRPKSNLSVALNQTLMHTAVTSFLGEQASEVREISITTSKLSDQYLVLSNNEKFNDGIAFTAFAASNDAMAGKSIANDKSLK